MKKIDDKSIDMILCDLPYGTTQNKWDSIIPFDLLWKQYERIIKDKGAIVLTASQPFTSALVMSNSKLFKYEWIWVKPQATNFLNANKHPLKKHETVLIFYKRLGIYNPQFELKEKSNIRPIKNQSVRSNSNNYGSFKDGNFRTQSINTAYPTSILHFNCEKGLHPTQKPVALFEYLIKTYTNEGDLVLDNCAGSGTTGIACKNTNRNYLMIEKDETYFNLIKSRMGENLN